MYVKTPKISARALLTPPSPIRKLSAVAARARARGIQVFNLNIGQPDIVSPQEFKDGIKAFAEDVISYEDSRGYGELREILSNLYNVFSAQKTNADQFIITTGASEALIFAFNVCCDADDEIVVFDPSYANYLSFATTAGVTLVPARCEFDSGFALPSEQDINSKICHRTKAILVCNPNNPTGTHYKSADLEMLLKIANERGLFLILDETYRDFVFDGEKAISILEIAANDPKVIVIDSLSKRYSLCGARIGSLYSANAGFMQAALSLAQARLSVSTIDQYAAANLLRSKTSLANPEALAIYESRRNALIASCKNIPGTRVAPPQGAFYAVLDLPVENAEDFCIFMLEQFSHNNSTTFLAPAQGFYLEKERGASEVRVAFVLEEDKLKLAMENVQKGLEAFKSKVP
jgi:aspartate aminotransferase